MHIDPLPASLYARAALALSIFASGVLIAIFSNLQNAVLTLLIGGGYLAVLSFEKRGVIEIDKNAGKLTVATKSLFSNASIDYPLKNISLVRLAITVSYGRGLPTYFSLDFLMRDGQTVSVKNSIRDSETAKKIADFIGVGFEKTQNGILVK